MPPLKFPFIPVRGGKMAETENRFSPQTPPDPSIERGRVFYLLSFISLATEDAPLGSLNSEGILLPSPGASDSLKFFKISSYSQQEKSKECRMWIIRGADGPLR